MTEHNRVGTMEGEKEGRIKKSKVMKILEERNKYNSKR